jgi:tripartite-type tricarboxylate transporter receptor subunit TctC
MTFPKSIVAVLALPFFAAGSAVCAQTAKTDPSAGYPSRPIRLVVPVPPGGSSDGAARIISQKLTEAWGQQVLVDNRTGAAEIIGTDIVVKSNPDGYTSAS